MQVLEPWNHVASGGMLMQNSGVCFRARLFRRSSNADDVHSALEITHKGRFLVAPVKANEDNIEL